jgi:membrane fusion protein (multidrug efflux system)
LGLKLAIKNIWNIKWSLKNVFIIAILILLTFISIYLYIHSKVEPRKSTKVVEVETINRTTIQKSIALIGTVQPKHSTILVAKDSGLLDILLSSGKTIKKGDLIAKIINLDIEKNYQLSKEAEEIANTQYNRFLSLQKKGFVSARELEEKKQSWIESQKDLAKTKNELKNLRFYSPFDGVIGAFKIREGSQINTGDSVVTIYDPSTMTIDLDIPCSHLKDINVNQPVYVFNQMYHLSHVQKMMDEDTHMCPADVDINCESCVIGDSVTVRLLIKEKQQALVIPTQALFLKNGKLSVYKVINNHIEFVAVKQGIQDKEKVEIISGLKPGDQIIIKSPERLYPGLEVAIFQPPKKESQG